MNTRTGAPIKRSRFTSVIRVKVGHFIQQFDQLGWQHGISSLV